MSERDEVDVERRRWQRRTGYVPQGGSWCVCDDGKCRFCEAQRNKPQPDAQESDARE